MFTRVKKFAAQLAPWPKARASFAALIVALFFAILSAFPVSAQTAASGYAYNDSTFQSIRNNNGEAFNSRGFGCGFELEAGSSVTNRVIPAETTPADASPVSGAPFCRDGSIISAANAYWATSDSLHWIVINGDLGARQTPKRAADSGLSGDGIASRFDFDSSGRNPTVLTISLSSQFSGSAISNEIRFDNLCRQDAGVLSWLVCPMLNLVNTFVEKLIGYVLDLLETKPILAGDLKTNGLYTAWSQFRTIANILLIPLFLFSIYAMLFSANNRYTVTRMLPRLVVAVFLMQLSFHIAAVIIDIGNLLAAGIAGIFNFVNHSIPVTAGALPANLAGTPIDRGVGAAVGTGLAISLGWLFVAAALPPVFIILVSLLAGILLAFVALALRQLAIVVMVILAPLAFVMGVLPNTERWLREWFDNLIKLVLFYPLVVLFLSAASTLSILARETGQQAETAQFISALLPVIALVGVPLAFKFAGNLFRNVTAALSGVTGRVKGGLIGDLRDPFSRAYQSRVGKLERRRDNTMRVASWSGLGWTARMTRPFDIQRQMYMAAGDRVKGYVSDKFPERLRRLFLGERPFKTRWNVEPWQQKDIEGTNTFRYEAAKLRRSEPEMANLAEVAAGYIGGHADRGLGFMFAVGKQYRDGTMARDVAETSYMTIRQNIKGMQRHLGQLSFDDITHSWVHQPDPDGLENSDRLFQYAYGKYENLPDQDMRERNYKIKQGFLGVASGTLVEGQGEDVWYATANALRDDRILNEYFTLKSRSLDSLTDDQRKFVKGVDGVLLKGEQVGASLKQRPRADAIAAMQGAAAEGEDVFAGGYRTAGNELNAMLDFINAAAEVREQRKQRGL